MTIIQQAIAWQVQELNTVMRDWYNTTIATESEEVARENLAELRQMYPTRSFRLVKVERVVSVIDRTD